MHLLLLGNTVYRQTIRRARWCPVVSRWPIRCLREKGSPDGPVPNGRDPPLQRRFRDSCDHSLGVLLDRVYPISQRTKLLKMSDEQVKQEQKENGWNEWQKLILFRLDDQEKILQEVRSKLAEGSIDIAMLKIKASIWGAVSGGIIVLIMIAVEYLKK